MTEEKEERTWSKKIVEETEFKEPKKNSGEDMSDPNDHGIIRRLP